MNVKKAIVFSLLVAAGTTAFAQTSNVRKAKSSLQKYEELKSAGSAELGKSNLDAAKEAIDQAIAHDKTKEDAEAWTVYALVNANLAALNNTEEAAAAAAEGIKKATELDKENKNAENIKVAGQVLGQFNFNQGVAAWEKQDFKTAYASFDNALNFLPGDTTLTYYSGLAAIQNQDYTNAIEKYKQLIPAKDFSSHKSVMVDLPKLYLSAKDTASALEYAAQAAQAYPNDNDAAVQNIELNLIVGNETKVISDIENQIAKDPNNKALYYYLGIAHSSANNSEKAIEAYKKAVAIDPSYSDANRNAAATIINSVRDELNTLNEDKGLSNTDYNTKLNALKEKIKEALPYLEKVVELNPQDVDALRSLKGYYDFQQDEAKSTEIQAKIDAAQQ
ncbi:tetratricopeptide repeat protein [Sphingobacterium allocomposti]|uniref:Tetratricopeptide repeat protein n=1 Tax=Sphingobacterium allocomposti TaxID=415956 RepID=A0A5S5DLP7_9SPHI|nr:tetratricopeptide repeat protein [Sphingobacterium composti Yoo et al. 2007 non Ten et al. 2007]TYP95679.1 tetratricopeptide repeat protein [Sphingobacterium composti Yoo et al. 2007 non Ten et al. 2007]HLS96570.1 tetratricopeptide repeat protein [Sphingobacterium sp.]